MDFLTTRRLLLAKQLLTDTPLPVTRVALASGFASLRRFNAAFRRELPAEPDGAAQGGPGNAGPGTRIHFQAAMCPIICNLKHTIKRVEKRSCALVRRPGTVVSYATQTTIKQNKYTSEE